MGRGAFFFDCLILHRAATHIKLFNVRPWKALFAITSDVMYRGAMIREFEKCCKTIAINNLLSYGNGSRNRSRDRLCRVCLRCPPSLHYMCNRRLCNSGTSAEETKTAEQETANVDGDPKDDHSKCPSCGAMMYQSLSSEYGMCINCEKTTNIDLLYFVWNENKKHGPVSIAEIIAMLFKGQLFPTKTFARNNRTSQWIPFHFRIPEKFNLEDKECIPNLEEFNFNFKKQYPELYRVLTRYIAKSKHMDNPQEAPKDEDAASSASLTSKLTRYCGVAVTVLMWVIYGLHCLGCIPVLCLVAPVLLCSQEAIMFVLFGSLISRVLISPITIVSCLLLETEQWDEIQSWMISYLAWGIFSFSISIAVVRAHAWGNHSQVKSILDVVAFVIGVDFGDFDLSNASQSGTVIRFSLWFLFPALASVLPCAACGYIANFVLEKKFELKCSEDITASDSTICFDDSYGCCEVISSHDAESSSSFLGGMASNILAVWAIIRICGYVMVNSFPQLAPFAQKRK